LPAAPVAASYRRTPFPTPAIHTLPAAATAHSGSGIASILVAPEAATSRTTGRGSGTAGVGPDAAGVVAPAAQAASWRASSRTATPTPHSGGGRKVVGGTVAA